MKSRSIGIEIPDFITHYSRSEPFQSLSSMDKSQWNQIINILSEESAWGLSRFTDPDYLPSRVQAEKKIRLDFEKIGGKPILDHPIYFFLGRNHKFDQHRLNRAYIIPLSKIPKEAISFTYGDSLLAFDPKYRSLSGVKYQNYLCEKVFCLDNLEELFFHSDYPEAEPLHVEAQLWIQPQTDWISTLDGESHD